MTKAAPLPLGFILLLAAATAPLAQPAPTDTAINEAVRRQADTVVLRQKLADAKAAEARKDVNGAAKIYEDTFVLVQGIGPSVVEAESAEAVAGLARTRLALARAAQKSGDVNSLREADTQVTRVLKVDPQNPAALQFKKDNDKLLADQAGLIPDEDLVKRIPGVIKEKTDIATLVQNGKLLYEMGNLDEAEATLKKAIALDPENQGAYYYLDLVRDRRFSQSLRRAESDSRGRIVEVEQAWEAPLKSESLQVPNPYSRTNLIYTGKGRQAIIKKLDSIRLDTVQYDGLPLGEVVRNLSDEAKKRDPEKRGINFIVNPNADASTASPTQAPQRNALTGLPEVEAVPAEAVDISSIAIKINPALTDMRLADVLDVIARVAEKPLKYSIEDYAVVFSIKANEVTPLFSRRFKVNPDTFVQGLQNVGSVSFGVTSGGGGSSGGGGGGGGGGGRGGGGGGSSSQQNIGAMIPRVSAAPGGLQQGGGVGGGGGGRGGGGGGFGGGGGGANGAGGLNFITQTNSMEIVSLQAINYFQALGVNLNPTTALGRSLFFNDRNGEMIVRATMQELDIIEAAIEVLNQVPPQLTIKARFVEVTQDDSKALGFDWYLGNTLMNQGTIGVQGGTAPTLSGPPTTANPLGTFPGNSSLGNSISGAATDGLLTSGLRNSAPALATLTGLLTEPQFRAVIHALEQRGGVDVLAEPQLTIISGRQGQMKATDVRSIITDYNFNTSGGIGGIGGAGASDRNLKTNFAPVDAQTVLAKVAAMPITTWNYKADLDKLHLGPMAQDFYGAFGIGQDDKTITFLDEGGVALAAIQGLNQKLEDKDAKIQALEKQVSELKALVEALARKSNGDVTNR